MQTIALDAKKREEKGKVAAKVLRQGGQVPAVVFGKKTESLPLSVPTQHLEKALHSGAAHKIVNLKIENGGEKMCVILEVQRDTFGKKLLHVDFHEISMEEKIASQVPVELLGTPVGVRDGGIIDHVMREVEVRALPLALPEKLTLDVSSLTIHQSLHVKDLKPPEGAEILHDAEDVVVVVHPPRVEEAPVAVATAEGAAATAAPAASAQPEVITKGKKEEEGAEEKPKK